MSVSDTGDTSFRMMLNRIPAKGRMIHPDVHTASFTVTSHVVSGGRLAPLIGRRFVSRASRVFCRDSILVCIHFGAGYIGHCVDGSFYFVIIPKRGKRRKNWLNAFSCKHWGRRSLKHYQPCFVLIVDISYHPAFIATHINTSYITECTRNGCIVCSNRIKEPCRRCRPRHAIQAPRVWINKMLKALFWSNNFNIYHTAVCQWYVGFHLTSGCSFLDCYFL